MNPKVWWILAGTSDLAMTGCSEEAVVLGILRLAEELALTREGSIVVIQGILPRTSEPDGSLIHKEATGWFHHKKPVTEKSKELPGLLWPSIQTINKELEDFCRKHSHIVYVDLSHLVLGSIGNDYVQSEQKIIRDLMPDYVHLSAQGYEVMGTRIATELQSIIYDEDEQNDIEQGSGTRRLRKRQ